MEKDVGKRIEKYNKRLGALKNERSSWFEHWRDLNDQVRPRRFRWLNTERNKGWKRNQLIINGTPTWALRTLAAGMMAGITSPARPWFRLTTADPDMDKYGPVRAYLDAVQDKLYLAFARSNLYNTLHGAYEALGCFGTTCFVMEQDEHSLLRTYPWPIGQFYLANSGRMDVDSAYRELSLTVGQMVEVFDPDVCSRQVREAYQKGDYDTWIDVVRVIEPNREYREGKYRFNSCWFESGNQEKPRFLRESGYYEKPFAAARWGVTAEDVYGESPAMDVLGDCRALQLLERRKAQVADKLANPPMKGPTSLMNQRIGLMPGEMTYVDAVTPGQAFAPAYEVPPAAVQVLREAIEEHAERIKSGFFTDIWLMLQQGQETPQKTATEVAELKEEKMLQLGPVYTRLENELLHPTVDRAYDILERSGALPPPPKEIQGQSFQVEFISIVAQALKMVQGVGPKERLASFVGNLAGVRPEVADNINWDAMVDEYADDLGVKSSLILTEDQVQAIRQQRIQQQQAQQQMQQSMAAVQGAQTLSKTDTSGDNALTRLLGGFPPAAGGSVQ